MDQLNACKLLGRNDYLAAGRARTADLGVMNPEFATAYNAFKVQISIFSGETVV